MEAATDIQLATSRTFRKVRNVLFDLRRGGLLRGAVPAEHDDQYRSVNSDVTTLRRIFRGRIAKDDVLVDVGCGKGRVLDWWAARAPGNRIVGLELTESVAAEAQERLRKHPNITVIAGDAVTNLPPDGTLFFLANPFGEKTVRLFAERAKDLYAGKPIKVIYYNPEHGNVFREDPAWHVEDASVGGVGYHRLCVITPA